MPSFPKMRANKLVPAVTMSKNIKISDPVGVSATARASIVAKLKNKKYREAYVQANLINGLAHQIRVNRESRQLSQSQFAMKLGMKAQASISRLEDPSYGRYSISTLQRIASVLDVALIVKFIPYSQFLLETSDKSPVALYSESFDNENLELRQAFVLISETDVNSAAHTYFDHIASAELLQNGGSYMPPVTVIPRIENFFSNVMIGE